jgi:hypothetical protein
VVVAREPGAVEEHDLLVERGELEMVGLRESRLPQGGRVAEQVLPRIDPQPGIGLIVDDQHFLDGEERATIPGPGVEPVMVNGCGKQYRADTLRRSEAGGQSRSVFDRAAPQRVQRGNHAAGPVTVTDEADRLLGRKMAQQVGKVDAVIRRPPTKDRQLHGEGDGNIAVGGPGEEHHLDGLTLGRACDPVPAPPTLAEHIGPVVVAAMNHETDRAVGTE